MELEGKLRKSSSKEIILEFPLFPSRSSRCQLFRFYRVRIGADGHVKHGLGEIRHR